MIRQETKPYKYVQSVKEYQCDVCILEILLFLRQHPRTRFSRLAIIRSLNIYNIDVEKAIICLEKKGMVKSAIENGVSYYALTENQLLNGSALELIKNIDTGCKSCQTSRDYSFKMVLV